MCRLRPLHEREDRNPSRERQDDPLPAKEAFPPDRDPLAGSQVRGRTVRVFGTAIAAKAGLEEDDFVGIDR